MKKYYLYIITNSKTKTPLHVGLSTDLIKTLKFYHALPDLFFESDWRLNTMVYFEEIESLPPEKIDGEDTPVLKRLKEITCLPRDQKIKLIEVANPDWMEITEDLLNQHIKNPKFI